MKIYIRRLLQIANIAMLYLRVLVYISVRSTTSRSLETLEIALMENNYSRNSYISVNGISVYINMFLVS